MTKTAGEARRRFGVLAWLLVALAVGGLIALGVALNIRQRLLEVLEWIGGLESLGPVIFIALYIASCVFFVPGTIPTLGAGVLFGLVSGLLYVSIGSLLGATVAFLIARYLARGWVARKIEGNQRFTAIDEAVAREGWKIVFLARLSPLFPFNVLNYAFGLTKVSLAGYVLASWAGMMPGTVLYVYIGSLAGSLATVGAKGRTRSAGEWALYAVGLVATAAVTVYITRIARRALREKAVEE